MVGYIIRRILAAIPLLLGVSIISFIVIQLPPGDYMTVLKSRLETQGGLTQDESERIAEEMRKIYGLDKPVAVQYFVWMKNMLTKGKLGFSFKFRKDAGELIFVRLKWTVIIAVCSHLISTLIGLSIGIYSATHQYSLGDNFATFLAFIGLSVPAFLTTLIVMYALIVWFRVPHVGGLTSPQYVLAPWDWEKFIDFLQHFWIPVVVVGMAGTARNMRVMRGNLLDILHSQYVLTARSKGLKERIVVYKHAVVNALHPIIMYQGTILPFMVQGSIVASIVLNLPTTGPMFYDSLLCQDMYLAGSFLMMLSVILIIGNLLADIVLAWVDPRVRFD